MTATEEKAHRLRPYPSYKDSGVEWIGEIPEGWEVKRLKQLTYSAGRGEGPQYAETSDVWVINQACVRWDGLDLSRKKFNDPSAKIGKGELKNNDVLINSTGNVTLGRSTVFQEVPEQLCIADNHITIVRTDDSQFLPHYLNYLIATPTFQKLTYATLVVGATAQIELSRSALLNTPFPTPPLEEQQAIVAFLDRETARIDELIREQEALLDDLSDKRQATCFMAVTRGITPSVDQVESGHPWVGLTPSHWRPQKISRSFKAIGSGTTPPSGDSEYYDGDIKWVNTGDLTDGPINVAPKTVTQEALRVFSTLRIYPAGTLIMAMYGATIGKLGILGFEACVNQACCAFVGGGALDTKFAFYWLLAMRKQIVALGYGGGQPNISQQTIRNITIIAPDLEEQQAIAAYLDEQLAQIDELREEVRANIEDMRIHRSALITAAVTGKIDVREAE